MKLNETAILNTPKYLGIVEAPKFKNDFQGLCELEPKKIVIDMSSTVLMTSAGLGTLLSSFKTSKVMGIELVLRNVNQLVMSVLSMAKLNDYFTIETATSVGHNKNKVNLLNVNIDNLTEAEVLEKLERGVVFTPNVDHLVLLQNDPEFVKVYETADYKLCDSKILYFVSRFMGTPIREKISGSDFLPHFCEYHKTNEDIKIFLLGAKEGVAKKAQENINAKIGRQIVIGAHSPSFGFEKNEEECLKIIEIIQNSGATVLAVGVGAPKQEKWIHKYKDKLSNIKIFLAIGASIDFEAGNKKRAPKWMIEVGLEWLYRLLSEPKRLWKRYLLGGAIFCGLVLKQKLNLYQVPLPKFESASQPIHQS
jgi:exopolysaccharide biosynthesis WecB/TagA/CpsF family protein/anti-anti-sigma factor